jgi:hypothetical protein
MLGQQLNEGERYVSGHNRKRVHCSRLPHLTSDKSAENWDKLRRAFHEAGQHVKSVRPDVLVMYSTQWISVLGTH